MKKIWIFNHYAGPPSLCTGLRHFNFAKYLKQAGYKVTIFASSAQHNSNINLINDNKKYIEYIEEDIPFVYIKTRQYQSNGKERIKNMFDYYKGVLKVADNFEKPDIIIGSSVHPLACLAAIKLSKKYHCKNIVEIRDLWPESIIAYGKLRRESLIAKILYKGEKYLYRHADRIVITWEGGRKYITDQGWQNSLDMNKIVHIPNGVDKDVFNIQAIKEKHTDKELENNEYIKIVYTGSVRKVNNLKMIVDTAEILKRNKSKKYKIIVFGDGDQRIDLEKYCKTNNIDNIIFKGKIDKKRIPNILKKADICLLHNKSTILDQYGQSQNKLFEYMASGCAILQTYTTQYSVCEKYKCGVMVKKQTSSNIANTIESMCQNKTELKEMGQNALKGSDDYDFKKLTEKLIEVIEGL